MNTHTFVSEFQKRENEHHIKREIPIEKAARIVHSNSTSIRIALIACAIIGVATIVKQTFQKLSVTTFLKGMVAVISVLVSCAMLYVLPIAMPPPLNREHHTFTPKEYGAGKLYYKGNLPILELESDNPKEAGIAHGYIVAPQISAMFNRLDLEQAVRRRSRASSYPLVLEKIRKTLPQEYVEELEGVVEGYNRWVDAQGRISKNLNSIRKITFNELLFFHILPDTLHFKKAGTEEAFARLKRENPDLYAQSGALPPQLLQQKEPVDDRSVACTTVAAYDPKKKMVFGRNLDWMSLNIFGPNTLVVKRNYTNNKFSTTEVSFPGFTGTLTGMNTKKFALAMNVCPGSTFGVRGMPAVFYNRKLLETSVHVAHVQEKMQKETGPLGPYQLTTVDPEHATVFHFYQGRENSHLERAHENGKPLVTSNRTYSVTDTGEIISTDGLMYCQEREDVVNKLFTEAQKSILEEPDVAELVAGSMETMPVNHPLTMHSIVMIPETGFMNLAFDNGYAATKGREVIQDHW